MSDNLFQLVWDVGDPDSETRPVKIVKANYASLDDALAQARHDLELGIRILGIANLKPKNNLHTLSAPKLEEKFIWTPKDDE